MWLCCLARFCVTLHAVEPQFSDRNGGRVGDAETLAVADPFIDGTSTYNRLMEKAQVLLE